MKNLGLILFLSVLLASCKKEGAGGCISLTDNTPAVTGASNAAIQTLLENNNLSGKNQVFYSYSSFNTQDPQTLYQSAIAIQVRNDLPIFYSQLYYTFKNGTFNGYSGKPYGPVILDTKSLQTLTQLKLLFTNEAINKQGLNTTYKDSCYVAQFGYYDLSIISNSDTTTNLVKAWEIHPKNNPYPQCYIRDDNGATISFDSGIRFLDSKKQPSKQ